MKTYKSQSTQYILARKINKDFMHILRYDYPEKKLVWEQLGKKEFDNEYVLDGSWPKKHVGRYYLELSQVLGADKETMNAIAETTHVDDYHRNKAGEIITKLNKKRKKK